MHDADNLLRAQVRDEAGMVSSPVEGHGLLASGRPPSNCVLCWCQVHLPVSAGCMLTPECSEVLHPASVLSVLLAGGCAGRPPILCCPRIAPYSCALRGWRGGLWIDPVPVSRPAGQVGGPPRPSATVSSRCWHACNCLLVDADQFQQSSVLLVSVEGQLSSLDGRSRPLVPPPGSGAAIRTHV